MELALVSLAINAILIFWLMAKVEETTKLEVKVKNAESETKVTLKALKELERLYNEVITELPHDADDLNSIITRMSRDESSGD